MKLFFYVINFLVIFYNCATNKNSTEGEITVLHLKKVDNKTWYFSEYNSYSIDTNTLKEIPKEFNNKNNRIEIFMGTWCSDSQREAPRFIKILEHLNFTKYRILALDENKKSKQGFEKDKNIIRVPTIIIYNNNNEEINRIIEYPVVSLENDLITILANKKYKPNYTE